MSIWKCEKCGFEYNESEGLKEEMIKPGTAFSQLGRQWICPDCGKGKIFFYKLDFKLS